MQDENTSIPPLGYLLLAILFVSLLVTGWYSYQSIDWNILKKTENAKLQLPPPQNQILNKQESRPAN